ncbi:gas vesicle protein [Streptomyces sp. NBC_00872]|uniref:gas vesicle protein n=1 Tax=Streptomyces sp. NBC_00872 TaxID=2903686 RepID=UPI00386551D0|nr:gas vesicle protein [Streptomyces sp. NBC_00872]
MQAVSPYGQGSSANLADILERVLDKGIVIAGDIQINLLDIELLTIKLRLLVASVDKAKEMGIDWWEHDPSLSSRAREETPRPSLAEENSRLRAEVENLRRRSLAPADERPADERSSDIEYDDIQYEDERDDSAYRAEGDRADGDRTEGDRATRDRERRARRERRR